MKKNNKIDKLTSKIKKYYKGALIKQIKKAKKKDKLKDSTVLGIRG